ncbi:MAG TPA: SLOG family protein [Leptospiraceae bacterium]|nr:SLOG family protein [Leptospiraceae bacterium]
MLVAIAGSRKLKLSVDQIDSIVKESGLEVSGIVSGKEPNGIDACGESWARAKGIPLEKEFPPDWYNFNLPKNIIKVNPWGKKTNYYAPVHRNHLMVDYLKKRDGALIVIWSGNSKGSKDVLTYAREVGIKVFEKVI